MSRPRNYKTEAIVIKKTKLGEADRILALYTPHLGKLQAVAKGVRRPRSKMSGHLELLTYSEISLARGRNLDTVTGVQTIESFLPLKTDLWLNACALYIAELVERFTPDDAENYPLFQLLRETLHCLAQGSESELVLRYFEMRLLDETGYRPQLYQCVACRTELAPKVNYFSPGAGGMLCPACQPKQPYSIRLSLNAQKVLRLMQRSDYDTVSCLKIGTGLSRELEHVLKQYLRYLLEGEVKSAAWLVTLRKQLKETATA